MDARRLWQYLLSACLLFFAKGVKKEWRQFRPCLGSPSIRHECLPGLTLLLSYQECNNTVETLVSCSTCKNIIDGMCIGKRVCTTSEIGSDCSKKSLCDYVYAGCVQDSIMNECDVKGESDDRWGFLYSPGYPGWGPGRSCQFIINDAQEEDEPDSEEETITLIIHDLHLIPGASVYDCIHYILVDTQSPTDSGCFQLEVTPGDEIFIEATEISIDIYSEALDHRGFLIEWKYSTLDTDDDDKYAVNPSTISVQGGTVGQGVLIGVLTAIIVVLIAIIGSITGYVLWRRKRENQEKDKRSKGRPQSLRTVSDSIPMRYMPTAGPMPTAYENDVTLNEAATRRPLPSAPGEETERHVYEEISETNGLKLRDNSLYDNASTLKKNTKTKDILLGDVGVEGVAIKGHRSAVSDSSIESLPTEEESRHSVVLRDNSIYQADTSPPGNVDIPRITGGTSSSDDKDRSESSSFTRDSMPSANISQSRPKRDTEDNSLYSTRDLGTAGYVGLFSKESDNEAPLYSTPIK